MAVARQEREGGLFTFVQGCYVLGKMQDLTKQDFLGATETHGRKALSAAQSIQEERSRREGIQPAAFFFCDDLSIAKTGRLLRRAGNHTHCQAEAYVWFVVI